MGEIRRFERVGRSRDGAAAGDGNVVDDVRRIVRDHGAGIAVGDLLGAVVREAAGRVTRHEALAALGVAIAVGEVDVTAAGAVPVHAPAERSAA